MTELGRDNGDFLKDLRAEIAASQQRRVSFVKMKLTAILSIFGLGSIKVEFLPTSLLPALVPLVVLVFDLFIIGENFGIRRAGKFFLSSSVAPEEERRWEYFAKAKRDPATAIANPVSSLIFLLVAAIYLWGPLERQRPVVYWIWFAISAIFLLGTWVYSRRIVGKLYATAVPPAKECAVPAIGTTERHESTPNIHG
jgi:phosphate/sulfate permease